MIADEAAQIFFGLFIGGFFELAGKIEVIPANDTIFDEAVAGFCDFLLFLFRLCELTWISDSDGAGEFIGKLYLVELLLDGLPQIETIDISQDKQGFDDLAKGLERLVERVLAGIGVEASEDVRGRVFLELDGGDKTQQIIPVFADQGIVDRLAGFDLPALLCTVFRLEDVEGLLADALDARGEGKAEQMRQAEDGFGVAVGVGRMDVALDHIIVHQPVDDIGTLAVGGADHQRMPQEMAFIDEGVSADALSLPEILERAAGVQAFSAHLEFLPVAGGMEGFCFPAVKVGQLHCVHGFDHGIIGRTDVIEREAPVDGVFQFILGDP